MSISDTDFRNFQINDDVVSEGLIIISMSEINDIFISL